MYSPHSSGQTHTNSTSIINPSTLSHSRNSSTNKKYQLPINYTPRSRGPSQKKLTITCQTNGVTQHVVDSENSLKKRGMEGFEIKPTFMSLQTSFSSELNIDKRKQQRNQIKDFKLQVQKRLQGFTNDYMRILQKLSLTIEELQVKLQRNEAQLRKKTYQIEVLQKDCSQYKIKLLNLSGQYQQHLILRIEDLETKVRILTIHDQTIYDEQFKSYDKLSTSIISYFGNKLQILKNKNDTFINKGLMKLSNIQSKLQTKQKQASSINSPQKIKLNIEPKNDGDKQSQRTQSSTECIGQSSIINQGSLKQEMSFWDDCFFYPSQRSENCELIFEMVQRRGEALHCWLDQSSFLRYYQSNSFIYNRRGDRIKLTSKELNELIEQNILII